MPFSDLTIKRSDIDGVMGSTFKNYPDPGTNLKLSDTDSTKLTNALRELKLDLQEDMSDLLDDGDEFDTFTEILDALYDADTENMLKLVLVYKFLELFFRDDSVSPDDNKARLSDEFGAKYFHYLRRTESWLRGRLSTKKVPIRYTLRHGYG